jgi:hypothetical protein
MKRCAPDFDAGASQLTLASTYAFRTLWPRKSGHDLRTASPTPMLATDARADVTLLPDEQGGAVAR